MRHSRPVDLAAPRTATISGLPTAGYRCTLSAIRPPDVLLLHRETWSTTYCLLVVGKQRRARTITQLLDAIRTTCDICDIIGHICVIHAVTYFVLLFYL